MQKEIFWMNINTYKENELFKYHSYDDHIIAYHGESEHWIHVKDYVAYQISEFKQVLVLKKTVLGWM